MNLLVKTIAWLFIFYCIYCVFLFLVQRAVLFPRGQIPPPPVPDVKMTSPEKIWIETSYGKIEAWYLPPAASRSQLPAPAVIFAHGNAELIDYWPEVLKNFSRMGIGLLLVEYPGYGRSSGRPSEQSIQHTFVAAYDALVSKKEIDPSRIVLFGRSIGGGAVCALSRKRPSAAMILMSAFTSVQAMASKFGMPGFLVRDPFNNLQTVAHYRQPLLVIHGQHDNIIPPVHGAKLHAAAENGTFITYRAGHNDCPPDWNLFWKDIESFLSDSGII